MVSSARRSAANPPPEFRKNTLTRSHAERNSRVNRPGAVPKVRRTGGAATSTDDMAAARGRTDADFGRLQLQFESWILQVCARDRQSASDSGNWRLTVASSASTCSMALGRSGRRARRRIDHSSMRYRTNPSSPSPAGSIVTPLTSVTTSTLFGPVSNRTEVPGSALNDQLASAAGSMVP